MATLHDCSFDLTRARFDRVAQTWTGSFLRPAWESPHAEQIGSRLWGCTRLPVVEGTITLSGVTNETVNDEEGIDIYGFDELRRLPSGVRFHFAEHLAIDLELSGGVSGTYDEEPLPDIVAVYYQRFLVQTGPVIERVAGASAA